MMQNTFYMLSALIAVPFIGMIFALFSKEDERYPGRNVYNVALFTVVVNLILIWRLFVSLDIHQAGLQFVERFNWLENPNIDIIFGIDLFSLLMILALHIAFMVGLMGIRRHLSQPKSMMVFSLLFLGMITGFFVAADIFSFYIFFEAMLIPLFMLAGMFGEIKRAEVIYRFFLYNLLGAVFLFVATVMIFNNRNGLYEIAAVSRLPFKRASEYFIWAAFFISFLSRIPIWPFHYWISAISSGLKNPLVFIIANLIPLTGLYGFLRFMPKTLPVAVAEYVLVLEIISVITMLFIALIGFINKDSQYKLFSYITVYYIMYLLGILSQNDLIIINIGFALFSYLIIMASLEVMSFHLYQQQETKELNFDGLLCAVPRLSFIYSFLILAGIGLPLSSLFLNNFLILSQLLTVNLRMGLVVVISLILVAATLLHGLYRLKDKTKVCLGQECAVDISESTFVVMGFILFVLLMSFVRPLWFIGW